MGNASSVTRAWRNIWKNTIRWPATAHDVTTGATTIYVHSGRNTVFLYLSWRALARRLRLCVDPCPRYLTPDDTHDRCVCCLGEEHARDVFEGAICVHCESSVLVCPSFRGKRGSRLLPAIRYPPLPRHGGDWNRGVRSWIWPMS